MRIESTKVLVNASQEQVFEFLSDSNNIHHLLPLDKITDWTATSTQCSFRVQSGILITLVQDGSDTTGKLFMKSGEKSPFPFRLTIHTRLDIDAHEQGDNKTTGFIQFDGEMKKFLKMMLEKPLTNLFNSMSVKMQEYFDENEKRALGES